MILNCRWIWRIITWFKRGSIILLFCFCRSINLSWKDRLPSVVEFILFFRRWWRKKWIVFWILIWIICICLKETRFVCLRIYTIFWHTHDGCVLYVSQYRIEINCIIVILLSLFEGLLRGFWQCRWNNLLVSLTLDWRQTVLEWRKIYLWWFWWFLKKWFHKPNKYTKLRFLFDRRSSIFNSSLYFCLSSCHEELSSLFVVGLFIGVCLMFFWSTELFGSLRWTFGSGSNRCLLNGTELLDCCCWTFNCIGLACFFSSSISSNIFKKPSSSSVSSIAFGSLLLPNLLWTGANLSPGAYLLAETPETGLSWLYVDDLMTGLTFDFFLSGGTTVFSVVGLFSVIYLSYRTDWISSKSIGPWNKILNMKNWNLKMEINSKEFIKEKEKSK